MMKFSKRLCLLPQTLLLLIFAGMLTISFTAINIGTALFGGTPLDLTSGQRYTLSEPTLKLLQEQSEPILIRLFVSPGLEESSPELARYAQYVMRFLEQFRQLSSQVSFELVEVHPFEATEEDAKRFGIRPFLDASGKNNLYFGAAISKGEGATRTIPYFEPRRAAYLEHDLTRLLSTMSHPNRPKIGLISPVLDIAAKNEALDTATDWPLIRSLRRDYNVILLAADRAQYPSGLDAVLVINPQNMPRTGIYALDQYLLRGGNVAVFIDPFSEAFLHQNGYINSSLSGLSAFLANLGVEYQDDVLIGDTKQAQRALISEAPNSSQIQNYPLWLDLQAPFINPGHALTQGLSRLRYNSGGFFNTQAVLSADVTPLLITSTEGGTVEADIAKFSDKSTVKQAFRRTGNSYPLAVLLEGKYPSYFPENPFHGTPSETKLNPFVGTSLKPAKLLLVADSDILFAPNWNSVSQFNGQTAYDDIPFNNNADFIEGIVDYLSSSGFVSLPPQSNFSSQRIIGEELRRQAEKWQGKDFELYRTRKDQSLAELNMLRAQISQNRLLPSQSILKRMELLEREYLNSREQLRKIEYLIERRTTEQTRRFILFNLLVWPLTLIILIWFIAGGMRLINCHRAERYTHV